MHTQHEPLSMTIMHYRLFNWYWELQYDRFMKLSCITKCVSVSRKKNSFVQEFQTLIFKTWNSGLGSLTAKSITSGTIYKACAQMTCPLVSNSKVLLLLQFLFERELDVPPDVEWELGDNWSSPQSKQSSLVTSTLTTKKYKYYNILWSLGNCGVAFRVTKSIIETCTIISA